jgi:hypothetical protein
VSAVHASINGHIALALSAGDFFEGIRAAGPQDLSGIKRLYQSLTLDLGLMLNSLSDDDFASPFLRIFVIEREGQVGATIERRQYRNGCFTVHKHT